ncbi:hypothetical protein HB852_06510 [Listeria grandensis]|uniref:Uncharacterized protein n=1 Tax=Listeria grandensis TaxID=1494963 RepID=A0A7X1CQ41_9LIST|nr:hypothetical protein [Listeria grandensis]MBC1474263.1 hypothetical protein [Listeria grandensis]MBC1936639.1 hypothetical protein [Listeria grandensis]
MGAGEISISLTEQEQLLVEMQKLAQHSGELTQLLKEAGEAVSAICLEGQFKDRIINNDQGTISRFTLKAQTLQTLAEVLSIQTENTYKAMIDTDKMLAMQVVNAILNEPGTTTEFKLACEQDPNAVIDQVKTYMKENK